MAPAHNDAMVENDKGAVIDRADTGEAASGAPSGTEDERAGPVPPPSLARGVDVIKSYLRRLPGRPGVYRMIDARGQVLYVGKAKNLRRRVASYAAPNRLSDRIARMVAATARLEVVTTHTEAEALLLEANLIKRFRPPFNVIFRDDKSFPYILITRDHPWPRLTKHRGARKTRGDYFGPFASAGAVNATLNALERAFLLRSCSDNVFAHRSRPCLLYQIKRCAGPCVGRIEAQAYARLVRDACDFLNGRSHRIQTELSERMQAASEALEYEKAAAFRDRIRALARIQARQSINLPGLGDADVIAGHQDAGQTCIQVFFFRAGQNRGNRAYFPRHARGLGLGEVLGAFIAQFYDNKPPPPLVLVSAEPDQRELLEAALSVSAGRRVVLRRPQRGAKRTLVRHAEDNAAEALKLRLAENASRREVLEKLTELFDLEAVPQRIEVYDNSHISGQHAIGAMIVAGPEGLMKNAYRKFNIRTRELSPGDDYGMIREVMRRRFARLIREDPGRDGTTWPDLVLIDGGAGQLSAARETLADLGLSDLAIAAIAKGPARNAGRERFFLPGREPFTLDERSPVMYFLQRLRDEAHRFAIGGHRARRTRALSRSLLDDIPGIGPRRKRALLNHFGSARAVAEAGLADLEAVAGINRRVAQIIYDRFHGEG